MTRFDTEFRWFVLLRSSQEPYQTDHPVI